MAYDIRSITQVGTSEPFELQVSRGQIPGHIALFKYGYNPLIINVEETVWDAGGVYTYPTSAVKMTATSAGGADDEFVDITMVGLDADYNEVSEVVTLDGTGVGESNTFFLRLYRAFVSGSQEPTGNVTITNSSTTYAQITLGENQTLMAVYTVPAGHTLYVTEGIATHGTDTSGAFMTVRLLTRRPNGVFRAGVKVDVIGSELVFPFTQPLVVPEKTDIEVRAKCSKNQNNAMSAVFQGILVKEQGAL
jgi:hypothetical protein